MLFIFYKEFRKMFSCQVAHTELPGIVFANSYSQLKFLVAVVEFISETGSCSTVWK
jgi:hypothetical protein